MNKLVNHNVIIDGHRIAYGIHGEGLPVVLIHGTPFFSHVWRKVLPALVESGFQVHLYDLLGFGYSERPRDPDADTSVSAQLPLLLGLLDHWGLDHCHFVAHDIGGGIAQQLGIYHPGRIDTLTLIDSVSFDSWPSERTRRQMQAGLDDLIDAPDSVHRQHFREWLLSAVYDEENLRSDALETYLDMISGPVGQGSLFQHQVRHYDPVHTDKLTPRLQELGHLPVQIVWGANDNWQVTDWARRLGAAIPGSSLRILDHCGHLVMEDQPLLAAELIISHVNRHCHEPGQARTPAA